MKSSGVKYIIIIAMGFILHGCDLALEKTTVPQPLVKVDTRELYKDQILADMPEGMTGSDSVAYFKNYIHEWTMAQLKEIEAKKLLGTEIDQIERMVQQYRTSLLNFTLEQSWVEKNLDTLSGEDEIERYYQNNKKSFTITTPLVKGTIVKVPKDYHQPKTLQRLMSSSKVADQQDFVDICVKSNFDLYEFTTWTEFMDFISVLPTVNGVSYEHLLKKVRTVQQMSDTDNNYYIHISNFSPRGENAPLETVKSEIKRILYNQHKQNIIKQSQEQLYKQAHRQERIIIFEQ